jgi:hypothetical protein
MHIEQLMRPTLGGTCEIRSNWELIARPCSHRVMCGFNPLSRNPEDSAFRESCTRITTNRCKRFSLRQMRSQQVIESQPISTGSSKTKIPHSGTK